MKSKACTWSHHLSHLSALGLDNLIASPGMRVPSKSASPERLHSCWRSGCQARTFHVISSLERLKRVTCLH